FPFAGSWTRDGRVLAFIKMTPTTGTEVWTLLAGREQRLRPSLSTRFLERYPTFSPDGRWLAYASDESGRDEVYVEPYPSSGGRQQISPAGGSQPAWSRDGRELFYTTTNAGEVAMIAVPITASSTLNAGTPRTLFKGPYATTSPLRSYDVSADGQKFL